MPDSRLEVGDRCPPPTDPPLIPTPQPISTPEYLPRTAISSSAAESNLNSPCKSGFADMLLLRPLRRNPAAHDGRATGRRLLNQANNTPLLFFTPTRYFGPCHNRPHEAMPDEARLVCRSFSAATSAARFKASLSTSPDRVTFACLPGLCDFHVQAAPLRTTNWAKWLGKGHKA